MRNIKYIVLKQFYLQSEKQKSDNEAMKKKRTHEEKKKKYTIIETITHIETKQKQ